MPIGLTFPRLLRAFVESWDKRNKELDVEIITAEAGVNPITAQYLKEYRKMFPDLTEKQILAWAIYLSAILDTIVCNNEAIAKSIALSK